MANGITKFIFALTPLVLLFTALEGGLWLAGVSPGSESQDPYVGFAAEIPLFVMHDEGSNDAVMRTAKNKLRFFNDQQFPIRKAPNTKRVFCLGGSTTYGRPYRASTSFCGWLSHYLVESSPETRWEVINAGGISYASYRAAAVMEELVAFEPDLFIVYSGHNEFLEDRTYGELRARPAILRWLDIHLRSLRSYTALDRVVKSLNSASATLDSREQLSAEVETRLESSVGPDSYHRDDELAEAIVDHYRLNLERMIALSKRSGAELVMVVPADNLSASSPFKAERDSGLSPEQELEFEGHMNRAETDMLNGFPARAHVQFAQATQIDSRNADALYGLGRASLAAGDSRTAMLELTQARDEDVCPLRATSTILGVVREVASRQGVPLVDFPAVIAAASADQDKPPGEEWFLDHVHPTIAGHRLLARALLGKIQELGWIGGGGDGFADRFADLDAELLGRLDEHEHGVALRNLAKVMSWAGKDEDAGRMAKRALEALGDDAESYFILSIYSSHTGDHDQAVAYLREALRIDPEWPRVRHNLAVELSRAERFEESITHYDVLIEQAPDHHSLRYNRANALLKLGRFDEAISDYRAAIARDPMDADARYNLARTYAKAGETGRAIIVLEDLIELDPTVRDAQRELTELLHQQKTIAPARVSSSVHEKPGSGAGTIETRMTQVAWERAR